MAQWFIILAIWFQVEVINMKKVQITVTSLNCAYDKCSGCGSQIIIDNKNYSPQRDGINIVVIDQESGSLRKSSFHNTKTYSFERFMNSINKTQLIIATSQLLCTKHKSINLRRQKSIIFAFEKFGASIKIPPISFRSGVYVYCKEKCLSDYPSNIKLPFRMFRQTTDDPILISFHLQIAKAIDGDQQLSNPNDDGFPITKDIDNKYEANNRRSNNNTLLLILLATIIPCVILGLFAFLVFLYLKWKAAKPEQPRERRQLNAKAVQFCECKRSKKAHSFNCSEKSPESKRKSRVKTSQSDRLHTRHSKQLRNTSSMRMFQLLENESIRRGSSAEHFATYVTVEPGSYYVTPCGEEIDPEGAVYKSPSNLKRHDPPKDLPPLCETKITPFIRPTKDASLHEYASPSDVGFIKSSGIDGLTRDVKKKNYGQEESSRDSTNSYDYTDSGTSEPTKIINCETYEPLCNILGETSSKEPEELKVSDRVDKRSSCRYLKLKPDTVCSGSYKDLSFSGSLRSPSFSSESSKTKLMKCNERKKLPIFSAKKLDKSSLDTYSLKMAEYSYAKNPEYEIDPKTIEDNGEYMTSVDGYNKYELEALLYKSDFWNS